MANEARRFLRESRFKQQSSQHLLLILIGLFFFFFILSKLYYNLVQKVNYTITKSHYKIGKILSVW